MGLFQTKAYYKYLITLFILDGDIIIFNKIRWLSWLTYLQKKNCNQIILYYTTP